MSQQPRRCETALIANLLVRLDPDKNDSVAVLVPWALTLLAPRTLFSRFSSCIAFTICGVAYVAMLALGASQGLPDDASFSSLAGVRAMFMADAPAVHAACWIHYLCFDLFVGLIQAETAPKFGLPYFTLWLTLPVTLMVGPAGLLLFGAFASVAYCMGCKAIAEPATQDKEHAE